MNIEQEIFNSYKADKNKLLAYGFKLYQDVYTFEIDFMSGDFKALILIDEEEKIKGKVIEKAFNEEYFQLRNESFQGGFVGEVRESYRSILLDIRNKCFIKRAFISNQANRLMDLIKERYDELPDYPFKDPHIKNYGVFRYKKNKKWYALLMNINKSNLDKSNKDEYVDVINVRINEADKEKIINNKNIYPSYHMNKKKWVSIILDDSMKDEEIMEFIDFSRNFMINKR